LLDSGDGASDDMAVHMHALENRAGGVPVRDYYFAWRSGRLGDAAWRLPHAPLADVRVIASGASGGCLDGDCRLTRAERERRACGCRPIGRTR
jgi:hypothetical protein